MYTQNLESWSEKFSSYPMFQNLKENIVYCVIFEPIPEISLGFSLGSKYQKKILKYLLKWNFCLFSHECPKYSIPIICIENEYIFPIV